jgi:mRNA interferase MazF
MTSYKRGDVILVRYPDSNLHTYKKRPALVVQDEKIQTDLDQTIAVMITSNLNRTGQTRFLVEKETPEGKAMGLLGDSMIVADNIATILTREIDKRIGNCPVMSRVDPALRMILGL